MIKQRRVEGSGIVKEEDVIIDLPHTEGLQVQGKLWGSFDAGRVALIAPAATFRGNYVLYHKTAGYLLNKGMACLRLTMFDNGDRFRNSIDLGILEYIEDLRAIVDYLRNERAVSKIDAIGHSLGALALLMAKREFHTTTLWEPSHGLLYRDYPHVDGTNGVRFMGDMVGYTDGLGELRSMRQIDQKWALGDTTPYAEDVQNLMAISAEVHPERALLAPYTQRYVDAAPGSPPHHIIPGATHALAESERTMHIVAQTTTDWIKQF